MSDFEGAWRPPAGGQVVLSDQDLAKIGLMVVHEASAKSVAAIALKAVERRSFAEWVRLDRMQFQQITERLLAQEIDPEFRQRAIILETARSRAHELRHIVVHAVWGEGGADGDPVAYDYSRSRLLGRDDINAALEGCADIKRAAHSLAYRVAELIEDGVLPEGAAGGRGMSIRTERRSVRL